MSDDESDIGANARTAASRLSNLRQRSWLDVPPTVLARADEVIE